jgi:hypothetical protein
VPHNKEVISVNPKLRKFLESLGLRAEATEAEAQAFYTALSAEDRGRADAAAAAPDVQPNEGQRNDPPAIPPVAPPNVPPNANADAVRQQIRQEELDRVRQINELAGTDVPRELVTRALNEGWNVGRATAEFLGAIRVSRGQPGPGQSGPAIHSHSHEASATVRALGMGLMLRQGYDPIANLANFVDGVYKPVRDTERNEELLRAADDAWHFRDMSLVDLCREACRIDSGRIPTSRQECIRTAISGSALSGIFTTNVSAELMVGFTDAGDSTIGWCSEAEVPNFQTNERHSTGKFGALTKHKRGGKADHLATDSGKEEYKIARYSGQFVVDEMDIIDDRLGALDQLSPKDIGLAARQLRPNMVYAILLANPELSDGGELFNSTVITTVGGHANLTSGALAADTLQAAITLMSKQRQKKRPLNLRVRYVIVPQDLAFKINILLTSAERSNNSDLGTKNPLAGMGLEFRADDRIGVAGVVDPDTGNSYAGTATNYFLAARPGEEGARTIEVGYLRGTGRAPQMRSSILTQGQWGIGWDINMDIGAKALGFQGLVKSSGG